MTRGWRAEVRFLTVSYFHTPVSVKYDTFGSKKDPKPEAKIPLRLASLERERV